MVNEVNGSHILKAAFTEIQDDIVKADKTKKAKIVSLKHLGGTKWNSIFFCVESLLHDKKDLKRLAITEGVILRNDLISYSVQSQLKFLQC